VGKRVKITKSPAGRRGPGFVLGDVPSSVFNKGEKRGPMETRGQFRGGRLGERGRSFTGKRRGGEEPGGFLAVASGETNKSWKDRWGEEVGRGICGEAVCQPLSGKGAGGDPERLNSRRHLHD